MLESSPAAEKEGSLTMGKKEPKPIIISAQQQFQTEKPRFNPFQTGHGAFTSKKAYKRKPKHGKVWE